MTAVGIAANQILSYFIFKFNKNLKICVKIIEAAEYFI